MVVTINSDRLVVNIDSLGAQLLSVRFDGKERLWQNNNGAWTSHAPVLFPVCGKVNALVDGKQIPLPQHGVVRYEEFEVRQIDASTVQMSICSNDNTRVKYPFDWQYTLTYAVKDNTLHITHKVTNTGKCTMYYSLGGHESFLLDKDVDKYKVVLPDDSTLCSLLQDENGLLSGKTVTFANDGTVHLPADFLDGRTMIFANVNSRKAILADNDDNTLAEVYFDGFANLMLWRPRGGHVICIEPWLNLPDPASKPLSDLSEKVGFVALAPNQTHEYNRSVKYF